MPRAEIDIAGGIARALGALERARADASGAHVMWVEPEEYTRTRVECALDEALKARATHGLVVVSIDGEGTPPRTVEGLAEQITAADRDTVWGPEEAGREGLRRPGGTRALEKIAGQVRAQARHLVLAVRELELWEIALRRGHGERLHAARGQGRLGIVGTRTRAHPWTNTGGDGPSPEVTLIGWAREEAARDNPRLQLEQDLEDMALAREALAG